MRWSRGWPLQPAPVPRAAESARSAAINFHEASDRSPPTGAPPRHFLTNRKYTRAAVRMAWTFHAKRQIISSYGCGKRRAVYTAYDKEMVSNSALGRGFGVCRGLLGGCSHRCSAGPAGGSRPAGGPRTRMGVGRRLLVRGGTTLALARRLLDS